MAAAGVPTGIALMIAGASGQAVPAYADLLPPLPTPTLPRVLPTPTPTPLPLPTLPPPPGSVVPPSAIIPPSSQPQQGSGGSSAGNGSGGSGGAKKSSGSSSSSGGTQHHDKHVNRSEEQQQSDERQDERDQQRSQDQQKQEAELLANLPALEARYNKIALAAGGGTGRFGLPELVDPKHPTPITQTFGCTPYPFEPFDNDCVSKHFHTGTDIAGPDLTPIFASDAGVVAVFQSSGGYGNYAVVTNGNGYQTLYGHMDKLLVQTGDVVHRGDVLGLEGSSGNSTGPHLHFEIRFHGAFVDPCAELDCSGKGDTRALVSTRRPAGLQTSEAPTPSRIPPGFF